MAAGDELRIVEKGEIARLEPNLREPPELAMLAVGEGAVDPVRTTQLLVRAAQSAGASTHFGEDAELMVSGARVTGVRVGGQPIAADVVVVAAGVGTNSFIAPAGISLPIESSPYFLVRFKSPATIVNRIVASPDRELRHLTDGMVATPEEGLAKSPKSAVELATASLKKMFKGTDSIEFEGIGLGLRPMPLDGLPFVGFVSQVSGLYLTVMHSGVSLAPLVSRLAADEIVDGLSATPMEPCRPSRVFV